MLEILLGSPKEAKVVFSIFRSLCKGLDSELQLVNQRCVKIVPKIWERSIENLVIPGIVQFIINHKEQQMMLEMIKDQYFFSEEEEQQQIIHIAQSIMEGERDDIPRVNQLPEREAILTEILEQFLRPDLFFSYSSFEKFRLHEYNSSLRVIVEVAIEEYKFEQEYQSFIQSLRDLLEERDSKMEHLSIVHKNSYKVYHQMHKELSEDELQAFLDDNLITEHPMYIDSQLLGPVVSIAPKKIDLYTDEPFDGMVLTIQNVFQERVSIHKLVDFYA